MRPGLLICFICSIFLLPQLIIAQDEDQSDRVKSIFFGGGSYYIDAEQLAELRAFIEAVPGGLEDCEIEIHGHTDNIGSVEYNQWLSQMRSRNVYQQLLHLQLDPAQLSIHDFGELSPVYDNATFKGQLSNRRVDVIIKRLVL